MLKHPLTSLAALTAVALAIPCSAASHARHAVLSHHAASAHVNVSRAAASHVAQSYSARGRHAERFARVERAVPVHHEQAPSMDPDRATSIQTALIREGYLAGQPTGVWDADSVAAMQKLQDANGWQTKYTPDSRALLKLGLGGAPIPAPQATPALEATTATPAAQP